VEQEAADADQDRRQREPDGGKPRERGAAVAAARDEGDPETYGDEAERRPAVGGLQDQLSGAGDFAEAMRGEAGGGEETGPVGAEVGEA
jgi:hypothetical protein